jgi:hypothetical protein
MKRIATHARDAVGGPLNPAFGNAPALVIATVALKLRFLPEMVVGVR